MHKNEQHTWMEIKSESLNISENYYFLHSVKNDCVDSCSQQDIKIAAVDGFTSVPDGTQAFRSHKCNVYSSPFW